MIRKFTGKLKEKKGESVAETLVAMLITVMGLMLLPGAIAAAARVNSRTEDMTIYVDKSDSSSNTSVTGNLKMTTGEEVSGDEITVNMEIKKYTEKKSGKSIYYYDK